MIRAQFQAYVHNFLAEPRALINEGFVTWKNIDFLSVIFLSKYQRYLKYIRFDEINDYYCVFRTSQPLWLIIIIGRELHQ